MKKCLAIALIALPTCSLAAELSLLGVSGVLTTPDTKVISEASAEFQANTDSRLAGNAGNTSEARSYSLAIGLLPRVELTGRVRVPDNPRRGVGDLAANLKVSLVDSQYFGLAAGVLDFAGDAVNTRSIFAVASASLGPITATAGFGDGQALDGAFGGLSYTPFSFVSVLADYDGSFYSGGTRLRHSFSNGIKVTATAKLYSDSPQKRSFGLSVSKDLGARGALLPNWLDSDQSGLRVMSEETGIVRAENTSYRQRQSDSDVSACATSSEQSITYQQYRYGLPILSTDLDCAGSTAVGHSSRWLTQWQERSQIATDFARYNAYGVELRFAPDLRSFVATEEGIFDYSLALFSTARLQLPAGLGGYVSYETPVSSTSNFDNPLLFDFYRHRKGVREAQIQWAHHLLPGVFGLHSYGRSRVFAIDYTSLRHDLIWNIGSGHSQIYGSYAKYKPLDNPVLPNRKLQYVGYRLFLPKINSSIEADYGDFFYGDNGFRVRANRYFGDTMVTLFLRRANRENQVAGLELSFPLTPRTSFSAGPVTVVGAPRFRFARGSSFGQANGRNDVKPLLMIEPEAAYNLRTDWLDSDRLFPAYPSASR